MENGAEQSSSVEIERNIGELRANPAYMDGRHPQHKDVCDQITDLYKKKHGDAKVADNVIRPSSDGTIPVKPPAPESNGDLIAQAQAEIDKLGELGVDVVGVDLSNATSEKLDGIKQLRLIEENNFEELGGSLSNSAMAAGMPAKSASFLQTFVREYAQPDDELTKIILTDIAEYIYKTRQG